MNPLREDLLNTGAALVAELVGEGAPAGLAAGAASAQEGFRLTPPSVAALSRAVAVLRAHGVPLCVRGSGDAPVVPPLGGVVLDLCSLDRISSLDGETGLAHVEAGCSVNALETAARRSGATLGALLPSVRAGSVGAWLAGPTRGERGVPGARRETAALSVAAVLGDGKVAESRCAPRSACGPDLDHLALGGGGRLCVIALAWVRLFPASPALSSSWRSGGLPQALQAVARLCRERLAPARARLVGNRLALAWEGMETAPFDRERAARTLLAEGLVPVPDPETTLWVRGPPEGEVVEVDAQWEALARIAPLASELQLVGLHAGGSFAMLALPGCGTEICAQKARAAGAQVVAPRRLRDAGPSWAEQGAGAVWQRLVEALGVEISAQPGEEKR